MLPKSWDFKRLCHGNWEAPFIKRHFWGMTRPYVLFDVSQSGCQFLPDQPFHSFGASKSDGLLLLSYLLLSFFHFSFLPFPFFFPSFSILFSLSLLVFLLQYVSIIFLSFFLLAFPPSFFFFFFLPRLSSYFFLLSFSFLFPCMRMICV